MDNSKKKRLVYKAVVSQNKAGQNQKREIRDQFKFPDNLDNFVSQPAKKVKLENEKKKKDNLLDDLIDDDFDFNEAANEIDQIEITLSQQISTQKPKKDHNDKTTLSLKIPKNIHPTSQPSLLSPLRPPLTKNIPVFSKGALPPSSNHRHNDQTGSTLRSGDSNSKIEELQKQLENYKVKLEESEKKYFSKDGEIKILRETLRKQSEDEFKHRETIGNLQHQLKTQQSEKEEKLQREVEKLQTELQFKVKEIDDLHQKQKQVIVNQSIRQNQSPKSQNRASFPMDGFMARSKNTGEKQETTSARTSKKKKFFIRTFTDIWQDTGHLNYSMIVFNDLIKNLTRKLEHNLCNHPGKKSKTNKEEIFLDFQVDFDSAIQILNQKCLTHFLHKIHVKIQTLYQKLNENNIQELNSQSRTSQESTFRYDCIFCSRTCLLGFLSLSVLSICAQHYQVLRTFLLRQICDIEKDITENDLDRSHDYTKKIDVSTYYCRRYPHHVLVETQDGVIDATSKKAADDVAERDTGNRIWTTISLLAKLKPHPALQEEIVILISNLSANASEEELQSLIKYTHSNYIVTNLLVISPTFGRIQQVISLLTNFTQSRDVFLLLCSKEDDCPLLTIYNNLIGSDDHEIAMNLFVKLVNLQSSLIAAHHKHALDFLLDTSPNCHCSIEVIECYITVLFDEFKCLEVINHLERSPGGTYSARVNAFRQGISLLCMFATHDKGFADKRSPVEWNFIQLICCTVKMFRTMPSVGESEITALEDLVDIEQYLNMDDVAMDE